MTSNADIARAMAENMAKAAVPLYGKKMRLPDRGAIIGIIKEFRRLLFPAYFGDPQLMALPAENYAALLLSRYRSGSTMKLVTVASDGTEMASLDSSQEVLSMSAAGKYIAVLYSDSLVLYTPQLQEYARLDGTEYARSVIMREDGTAVLIGSSSAWLYIP